MTGKPLDTWFFLCGYVKDQVFVPPLPRDLADLRARIIAAVKNIDTPILTRLWQETEYRIDVCRVTRGAHIERH
jgi:aminoglycoside phosphotransferase (APT) family kinase protein